MLFSSDVSSDVSTTVDLKGCSDELKESVDFLLDRWQNVLYT